MSTITITFPIWFLWAISALITAWVTLASCELYMRIVLRRAEEGVRKRKEALTELRGRIERDLDRIGHLDIGTIQLIKDSGLAVELGEPWYAAFKDEGRSKDAE